MPTNRKHQSIPAPGCGGRMIIIETFQRGCSPHYRPTVPVPVLAPSPVHPGSLPNGARLNRRGQELQRVQGRLQICPVL
jgi:hypothetical protein